MNLGLDQVYIIHTFQIKPLKLMSDIESIDNSTDDPDYAVSDQEPGINLILIGLSFYSLNSIFSVLFRVGIG